jgi:hypothetical protein
MISVLVIGAAGHSFDVDGKEGRIRVDLEEKTITAERK